MTSAQLPPIAHLELRINRAVRVFNRAYAAAEKENFSRYHFNALRETRDEIASLAAHFRDRHWGNLSVETRDFMAEMTEDMEALMHDVIRPAFDRQDERQTHRPGEYTCSRILSFSGTKYRKDIPCRNPAYAVAKLDEWESQLINTLMPAESRA